MSELVTALRCFNRKERYWLLNNALGESNMQLGADFRKRLADVIDIEIPPDAWWAMDYHLDWLIGALHLLNKGALDVIVPNIRRTNIGLPPGAQSNNDRMVRGTQQDIDLVIAFNETLILIEAKGATSWSNAQFNSKLKRLRDIFSDENQNSLKIELRGVLMSPRKPPQKLALEAGSWPIWMSDCNNSPLFLELKMGEGLKKVIRCNDDMQDDKDGEFWTIR